MADPRIDLDAYLARVGYGGPREPTLAVLRALHVLHPAAIPFENLDPLMGAPVSLSLDALQAKLVAGGRGGYCYEQNGLFKAALEALGFQVTGLAARVRWGAAEDAPLRPRSHMLLRVSLPEGPYLADVGFGGLVLTAPLRLDSPDAQATPHERFRLAPLEDGVLELQAELGQAWRALYRFDMAPHLAPDYEPLSWFSGTHPSSPFTSSLMAARTGPEGRFTLSDTRFTARRPGLPPAERTLATLEELKSVLREDFGLTLPEGVERIAPKLGL
jgi:N-hydroxyarylamine O-acetyltransferase